MEGLILFGVVGLAAIVMGAFMYRSMKATGGCGCCSHLNKKEGDHAGCECQGDHDHTACSCSHENESK